MGNSLTSLLSSSFFLFCQPATSHHSLTLSLPRFQFSHAPSAFLSLSLSGSFLRKISFVLLFVVFSFYFCPFSIRYLSCLMCIRGNAITYFILQKKGGGILSRTLSRVLLYISYRLNSDGLFCFHIEFHRVRMTESKKKCTFSGVPGIAKFFF